MKQTISLIASVLIVWAVCCGIMMLLDFDLQDAVVVGFSSAMVGVFAPIFTAWFDKKVRRKK